MNTCLTLKDMNYTKNLTKLIISITKVHFFNEYINNSIDFEKQNSDEVFESEKFYYDLTLLLSNGKEFPEIKVTIDYLKLDDLMTLCKDLKHLSTEKISTLYPSKTDPFFKIITIPSPESKLIYSVITVIDMGLINSQIPTGSGSALFLSLEKKEITIFGQELESSLRVLKLNIINEKLKNRENQRGVFSWSISEFAIKK